MASTSRLSPNPAGPENELSAVLTYISRLDANDIDRIQSCSQSLGAEDTRTDALLSDEELALRYFAEEAQGLLAIAKEYLTSDPDYEIHGTPTLLHQLVAMEEMARRDRELAIALSEGRDPPSPASRESPAGPSILGLGTAQDA